MGIETILLGFLGVVLSAVVAFFAGNRAATKKAQDRERVARAEQEVLRARDAEAAAREQVEAAEIRRRVNDAIARLPPESTDTERSAADRLRDDWTRD